MIVAVTSTVVFEIPDGPIADVKQKFREAFLAMLGFELGTRVGQAWVQHPWRLQKIERLEVERR